jgi:hypothetical protein
MRTLAAFLGLLGVVSNALSLGRALLVLARGDTAAAAARLERAAADLPLAKGGAGGSTPGAGRLVAWRGDAWETNVV